jgi:small neutral amino acid transporter SnatA (MarC family)
MLDKILHDIVTLVVVIDPIGAVPLCIAVSGDKSAARDAVPGRTAAFDKFCIGEPECFGMAACAHLPS